MVEKVSIGSIHTSIPLSEVIQTFIAILKYYLLTTSGSRLHIIPNLEDDQFTYVSHTLLY